MDYVHVVAALRAKARDKATTPEERCALYAKADEIEKSHGLTPQFDSEPITGPVSGRVQGFYVYQSTEGYVRVSYDFPADWYETMDNWEPESGCMDE